MLLTLVWTASAQDLQEGLSWADGPVEFDELIFQVPGAPDNCHSAYTLPLSHPMMAPQAGIRFQMKAGVLEGADWGACTHMVPTGGERGVWIVQLWDPGARGDVRCSEGSFQSPTLRVGPEDTAYSNEVKLKWRLADPSLSPGAIPDPKGPCPISAPPPRTEPTPGVLSDPMLLPKERKWSLAAMAHAGRSGALGGFAYGARVGVGRHLGRFWVGPAVELNEWQARPWPGDGLFNTWAVLPTVWSSVDLDEQGRFQAHAAAGAGPARFQRDRDPTGVGDKTTQWATVAHGSIGVSAWPVLVQLRYQGPGIILEDPDFFTDMRNDLQLTGGLILRL